MLTETYQLEQEGMVVVATIEAREMSEALAQELALECLSRMRYHNAVYFVFDVRTVTFMSSSCLTVLVQLLQDLEHVRGRLALVRCQPNVAFLFRVTRLDKLVAVCADVEEAKEWVTKG